MSQPSREPLAMYSSIFSCIFLRLSLGDITSVTKYGQIGANFFSCSREIVASCSGEIQAASGAQLAPFGKVNPPLESVASPLPTLILQARSCPATHRF